MKDFRFTLSGPEFTAFNIEEPMGWADIVQTVLRDPEGQGVIFEATISSLGFYGPAALFLMDQKETKGLKAEVNFLAEERCRPADPYEEVLRGRLNFGRFESTCGLKCDVTMPVEQEGCKMTFKNRLDQNVDIDSLVAFDKFTGLNPYTGLGFDMTLAAQELFVSVVGDVGLDGDDYHVPETRFGVAGGTVRPNYKNKVDQSISIAQLEPTNQSGTYGTIAIPTSPILLLDDEPACLPGPFEVDIRLKGNYDFSYISGLPLVVKALIWETSKLNNTDIFTADDVIFAEVDLFLTMSGAGTGSFDISYVNPATTLRQGYGLYAEFFWLEAVGSILEVDVHFDPETHVSIKAKRACPPTEAKVYLINETLSRMAEAITDNCVKVKSDYYGRTDSQPYASGADGCGGLRVLTNGLNLRKQPSAKMFMSMEAGLRDLKAIDNIGWGFEPNTELPGFDWLRVEPVEYFYQDYEILRCPYIPEVKNNIIEKEHYSVIKAGYNKWEAKAIRGLNEFNSTREFRTSLETVKNPIDITSNLIAAGSVIESVRRESFAESGQADTAYDNDNFIICVEREIYGYKVEQGHIVGDVNIFSPATVYNYRISPMRNLMRWFKSLANSYANIVDSAAKLFFSSGTGNYTATGQLIDDCSLENAPIAENKDLSIADFLNTVDGTPLYRPENITFNYPISASEFSKIKANPRGYVSYQCGTGGWLKGYITEVNWRPAGGMAEFKLKLKWNYV